MRSWYSSIWANSNTSLLALITGVDDRVFCPGPLNFFTKSVNFPPLLLQVLHILLGFSQSHFYTSLPVFVTERAIQAYPIEMWSFKGLMWRARRAKSVGIEVRQVEGFALECVAAS